MPCGARAGRVDSGRNSERHVPRRKAGARTTSTTGNSRRGFIDQVPGPTAPAGDMAVRNSPASTRRDTKTFQMRICDIPRCGELKVRGQQRDTRAWCLSKRMRTPRLVVQSSRSTRRGSVSISSAGTIPVAGQPEQSMAASGADDARIDHVRRRRGPVARRLRRCARAAPSARNILPPGPTRLANAGIALLGTRA